MKQTNCRVIPMPLHGRWKKRPTPCGRCYRLSLFLGALEAMVTAAIGVCMVIGAATALLMLLAWC